MVFLTPELAVFGMVMSVTLITLGWCIHKFKLHVVRGDKDENEQ